MMTILVLAILAATVIISLSNTNIIGEASKAVLKSNLSTMQDIAKVYFADNYLTIDLEKEYLITEFGITDDEFKDYVDIAIVKTGKVYIKQNAPEDIKEVAAELNMLLTETSSDPDNSTASKEIKNLIIYGNSVQNGTPSESTPVKIESVGEMSKNLLDYKTVYSSVIIDNGEDGVITTTCAKVRSITYKIPEEYIGKELTFSAYLKQSGNNGGVAVLFHNSARNNYGNWINGYSDFERSQITFTPESTDDYVQIFAPSMTTNNVYIKEIQLELGSEVTDYEEFCYKVPVTVQSDTETKTYNICLNEPLRKVGDTADYIDCAAGKVMRYINVKDATGTKDITESFEVLSTPVEETITEEIDFTGVKNVDVNTTIKPSNVEIKY